MCVRLPMKGAVVHWLFVFGLCPLSLCASSFLPSSHSHLFCSLPRARCGLLRGRGGTVLPRRHSQHLRVRDLLRGRLPQQQQPHLAHVRFFSFPFVVFFFSSHGNSLALGVNSSWTNRDITSIPSSISLLKDLITLFVLCC